MGSSKRWAIGVPLAGVMVAMLPVFAWSQAPAPAQPPRRTQNVSPPPPPGTGNVIKVTSAMTLQQLLARPDTDLLELPDGKRMTVGQLRRRAQIQSQGRLSTTWVHGNRARKLSAGKHGAMLNILRAQKQAADSENASFRAIARGAAGGALSSPMSGTIPLQTKNTRTTVMQGAPQPAGPSIRPPLEQGPPRPGIVSVNGKPNGVYFTPDPQGNPFSIKGHGFGDQPGQVYIYGQFRAGKVVLDVLDWQDDHIAARVNPDLVGELDGTSVTVVVVPTSGQTLRKDGFYFYAAREVVLLPRIPHSFVNLAAGSVDYETPGQTGTFGTSVSVFRSGVRAPGSDYYHFESLTPGFTTYDFETWHGETRDVAGICDSFSFTGTYAVNWDGDNIRADWGERHCHVSPVLFVSGSDSDVSLYLLNVWVIGPRGVNPLPY